MKTDKKHFINNVSSQYYLKLLNKFQNQRRNLDSLKAFRASAVNNNMNKNKPEIPYSIKPLFCSVPKDVNMHKILINMMNSSFKINGNKSIYVKMSQKDLKIRNSILSIIKSFINNKGISKKIFCAIIFLYDILNIKNLEKKIISTQEELGIGALLLTIKFIKGIKKSLFKNILSNFDLDEEKNKKGISEIEINCLKLIDYYLSFASPISFLEIFFINGIIFSTDNIKTEQSGRIYELVLELIEKIMFLSNEYIKYNPLCLCACIVAFAREIYHLENWPKILTQAFGVNFSSFESIYNEFHDFIMANNKNDENKLSANNVYKHKSLVKFDVPKTNNYLNNKYNSIDGNNCTEMNWKNKKSANVCSIKNFLVEYEDNNNEENNNYNNNNNKIKDIDTEIPSLTEKKSYIFKSIFGNKINDNIKVNKKTNFDSNKEEDYSNAVTSENSNNYNKNYFRLNHDKSKSNCNISPDNNNNEEFILNTKSSVPFTSQKIYKKKYERWNSIKKISKMKNEDGPKESFYPYTEMKQNYNNKKNYCK